MTNIDLAKAWLKQASVILDEAVALFGKQVWHLVVRRCQESTELALKAILAHIGVEVPKLHDVGHFLKTHEAQLPHAIIQQLDKLAMISRQLRAERETSFYGDDQLALPPDEIYEQVDADAALKDARFVLNLASQALSSSIIEKP